MKSEFLKLNLKDLGRGAIVAILTAVLIALEPIIQSGDIPDIEQLKAIGIIGISAGVAYLIKNLLTSSKDKLLQHDE